MYNLEKASKVARITNFLHVELFLKVVEAARITNFLPIELFFKVCDQKLPLLFVRRAYFLCNDTF